jgi:tetratricopeptide (TPR) repeat protein
MTFKSTKKNTFFNVRPGILICLFFVIAILLVYWQVRNYSFVNYDDRQYVTHNHHVNTGFTLESIKWSFTAIHASNWHPVTWLSHMLDSQIYGMNAGHHHMTNVLLHILNTLLVFLVLKRMTGKLWHSSFVAALFALHPLHVESVAWVAERKDLLSTFFWMLALWSYTRYVEGSAFKHYLLVVLFFIIGLMAKPMLVTLPFLLVLLDYWPLRRFELAPGDPINSQHRRFNFGLIYEKIPLFFLSALSSIVTYIAQESSGAVNSLAVIPFHIRIANATVSYVSYIGKMIWPHHLAVFYPYPEAIELWKVAGAGVLLGIISVAVCRMVRTKPYFAVGWFWYIGTLVPVIGIVQVGVQKMADRYTYVSLIGLFIIIAWGVSDILDKWRYKRIILAGSTIVVLSAFTIYTWFQIKNWQNSITLFEHALNVTVDNSVAHINLGEALAGQGKTEDAIRHYNEALRIKPNLAAPLLNLGVALREKGEIDEAVKHFSRILRFKSDCVEAYYELAETLKKKGDVDGAVKYYLDAIRIKPDQARLYNNLGAILADKNKPGQAREYFYKALEVDPNYAGAYYNLGKISANQGQIQDAILNYRNAFRLDPDMTEALYHLSWILACCESEKYRNGVEAVKLAEQLCEITQYGQPLALDALAAAYAEMKRFDKAVLTAEKALQLALDHGSKELAAGLKERLELYRKGLPYRQTPSGESSG